MSGNGRMQDFRNEASYPVIWSKLQSQAFHYKDDEAIVRQNHITLSTLNQKEALPNEPSPSELSLVIFSIPVGIGLNGYWVLYEGRNGNIKITQNKK